MPTRTYRSRPGARHEKLCACLMEGCGCASYTETETAYPTRNTARTESLPTRRGRRDPQLREAPWLDPRHGAGLTFAGGSKPRPGAWPGSKAARGEVEIVRLESSGRHGSVPAWEIPRTSVSFPFAPDVAARAVLSGYGFKWDSRRQEWLSSRYLSLAEVEDLRAGILGARRRTSQGHGSSIVPSGLPREYDEALPSSCSSCGMYDAMLCAKCETCPGCCECAWPAHLRGGVQATKTYAERRGRVHAARPASTELALVRHEAYDYEHGDGDESEEMHGNMSPEACGDPTCYIHFPRKAERASTSRVRHEGLREASIIEYIDDVRYEDPRDDRRTFDEDQFDENVDELSEASDDDDDDDDDDDSDTDDDDDGVEYLRTSPAPTRKMGSRVQSLMFSKDYYTPSAAKAWAKAHGYAFGKVDSGGPSAKYHHLRQFEPDQAASGYGTITLKTVQGVPAIRATVAVPKWRADMGPQRLKRGEGKVVEKRAHGPKQTKMFSERLHTLPGSDSSRKRSRDPHELTLSSAGWKAVLPDARRRVAELTGRDASDIDWYKILRAGRAYLAPAGGGYRVYFVSLDGTVDWKTSTPENVDETVLLLDAKDRSRFFPQHAPPRRG